MTTGMSIAWLLMYTQFQDISHIVYVASLYLYFRTVLASPGEISYLVVTPFEDGALNGTFTFSSDIAEGKSWLFVFINTIWQHLFILK